MMSSCSVEALPEKLKTEVVLTYDNEEYDFRSIIEEIVGYSDLENLHKTAEGMAILRQINAGGKAPVSSRNAFNKKWRHAMCGVSYQSAHAAEPRRRWEHWVPIKHRVAGDHVLRGAL